MIHPSFLVGLWCAAALSLSNCQRFQTPPRLSSITAEQLAQAPIVVLGRVAAIDWGPVWAENERTLRHALVTISNTVSLSGKVPADVSVSCYLYQSPYAPPFEGQAYNHVAINQSRIFFLEKRGLRYFGIRDGDALSFRTASVFLSSDFRTSDLLVDSIVRVLIKPARDPIDSGLPDRVSYLSANMVDPLVGKAQGLRLLEGLLESRSVSLRTRACESILYSTGLPHRCLEQVGSPQGPYGIEADASIRHCLLVNAARFAENQEIGRARSFLMKECESPEKDQFASWIDQRKDCSDFVELAVSHLARRGSYRY